MGVRRASPLHKAGHGYIDNGLITMERNYGMKIIYVSMYSPAHELLSTRIFANIREFSRIFANEKKKKKKKIFFFFFFNNFFMFYLIKVQSQDLQTIKRDRHE